MSLLREIQNDLARPDADVVTVLRKCKILAARLNSVELTHWVDSELNGYAESEPLPEYRMLRAQSYGNFMSIGWRAEHQPIPAFAVPEEDRETFFAPIGFRDGITIAMVFASDGATAELPWLTVSINRHRVMFPQMECMSAWRQISGTQFRQLVDAVKNRILDFSLKIEAENPSAGEALPNSEPVAKDKLQPLVQNTFYGPVANVAQNSANFTQTSGGMLQADELSRLVRELTQHLDELGLDDREKQRVDAQVAILKTELSGEPDLAIVTQAGRTLRNITEGAIGSLIATAAQPDVWVWIHQMLAALGAK